MTATATATPYGYCPTCGAPGKYRERRFNGDGCDEAVWRHLAAWMRATATPATTP